MRYWFGGPAKGAGVANGGREGNVDVSGAFARLRGEIVDGRDDAFAIEMPFDEEAIGRQAAMQWACGDAVEVGNIASANGPEPVDVEVGVLGFEGVKGPFDEANTAAERVFALEKF